MSNDESTIKFENLSEIFTPLQQKWKTNFHTFSIQYYDGFTFTIEIYVRHYCRLSLLLILQSNNLYKCVNYIIEYGSKKGYVYIFTLLYTYFHTI